MKTRNELDDIIRDNVSTMLSLVVCIFMILAIGGVLVATERHLARQAKVCQEACVKW